MDIRTRLLEAAARLYGETGYRGATTRRIAQEAGVSEITLFRQFGSKESLILEAVTKVGRATLPQLPEEPVDPYAELTQWCRIRFEKLNGLRSLLRKIMGEVEEHPEIIECAKTAPHHPALLLEQYVRRLQARGLASADIPSKHAAALLMGAIFTEAMVRDMIPEVYSSSAEEAIESYVRLFLRAIGAPGPASETSAQ